MGTKYRLIMDKRIASCFASFSSNDVLLYKEVDAMPTDVEIKEITVDKVARVKILYVEADKTFDREGLAAIRRGQGHKDFHKTPEFLALVEKYKAQGWVEEPDWLRAANNARYEREDIARQKARKRAGYVLYQRDYATLKPVDYQGGFSDTLFGVKELADYVARGTCFGYIGHLCRKPQLDALIEKEFMCLQTKGNFSQAEMARFLAVWLTSSDGRHFGDSLENERVFIKQKALVRKNLQWIFNLAYIYSQPEHKGSMDSTRHLHEKYAHILFGESTK